MAKREWLRYRIGQNIATYKPICAKNSQGTTYFRHFFVTLKELFGTVKLIFTNKVKRR